MIKYEFDFTPEVVDEQTLYFHKCSMYKDYLKI